MNRTAVPIVLCAGFLAGCLGSPEPTDGVYEFATINGDSLPATPLDGCCVWRRGVVVLDGADWELSVSLARQDQSPGDRVRERDLEFVSSKFGSFVISGETLELVERFDNAPDIHLVDPVIDGSTITMTITQDLTWGVQEYRAVFHRAASQEGRGVSDCWKGTVLSCPN
jgi:hypothetical protein